MIKLVAATNTSFASRIDPDDPSFLNPADMPTAIKKNFANELTKQYQKLMEKLLVVFMRA